MADKLGTLIREGRNEKGWTQAQLAAKVKGLSASDIGRIERGEKKPDTDQIRLIAKALGVTQTSLLNAAGGKSGKGKTSGSGKSASSGRSGTSVRGTAAEKKILQQYRKADEATRSAVERLLGAAAAAEDTAAGGDLLNTLLSGVLEQVLGKK